MNEVTYRPGTWQVVVEEGGVVAVPGDAAPERVRRLGEMLRADHPELTEIIDVLAEGSLARLGAFAVALTAQGGVRLAVRGAVSARIDDADGGEQIAGSDVSTWSERLIANARTVHFSLDGVGNGDGDGDGDGRLDSGTGRYAIRSGVVLAGAVQIGRQAETQSGSSDDAVTAQDAPEQPATTPVAGTLASPSAVEAPDLSEDAQDADADAAGPEVDAAAPEGDAASLHTLVPNDFTFAPEPPTLDDAAPEETVQLAPRPPLPAAPPAAVPTMPVAPPPPLPPVLGDHDGATISLVEARRLRAETPAPEPTSPDAVTELLPTAEPATGRIRLSTGQVIELDRTVIIGRRPRSTRASGESMPHLVAVESPQQDISRSHLEVRPEGDSVVVIDLRTTNGSTLIRPGADPMRLHPGEHTLVLDGDVIDLGDGVTVAFEGLA